VRWAGSKLHVARYGDEEPRSFAWRLAEAGPSHMVFRRKARGSARSTSRGAVGEGEGSRKDTSGAREVLREIRAEKAFPGRHRGLGARPTPPPSLTG